MLIELLQVGCYLLGGVATAASLVCKYLRLLLIGL